MVRATLYSKNGDKTFTLIKVHMMAIKIEKGLEKTLDWAYITL